MMRDSLISLPRVEGLHPVIKDEVLSLIEKCEQTIGKDFAVRIVQGTRTIEYQNGLFSQPHDHIDNDHDGVVDEPDEKVTNAKGGLSYHNYGLAFDFCLLFLVDGKYQFIPTKSWQITKEWMIVVNTFKLAGYEWGGDWHSLKDNPHIEKTFGNNWRVLLQRYNNQDFVTGTKFVRL